MHVHIPKSRNQEFPPRVHNPGFGWNLNPFAHPSNAVADDDDGLVLSQRPIAVCAIHIDDRDMTEDYRLCRSTVLLRQ